jgi:hypothetical protein
LASIVTSGYNGTWDFVMSARMRSFRRSSTPVIDKFVLKNFGLRLPNWNSLDRESRTVDIYRVLCSEYEGLLKSATGAAIKELFDRRFPAVDITELKKVDLVLWPIRA